MATGPKTSDPLLNVNSDAHDRVNFCFTHDVHH